MFCLFSTQLLFFLWICIWSFATASLIIDTTKQIDFCFKNFCQKSPNIEAMIWLWLLMFDVEGGGDKKSGATFSRAWCRRGRKPYTSEFSSFACWELPKSVRHISSQNLKNRSLFALVQTMICQIMKFVNGAIDQLTNRKISRLFMFCLFKKWKALQISSNFLFVFTRMNLSLAAWRMRKW